MKFKFTGYDKSGCPRVNGYTTYYAGSYTPGGRTDLFRCPELGVTLVIPNRPTLDQEVFSLDSDKDKK